MKNFLGLYLLSVVIMVTMISPLLAEDEKSPEDADGNEGPDLWDLTPEITSESSKKSHKKKVHIVNKAIKGRFVGKEGEDSKNSKSTLLGDGPQDSSSVLQVTAQSVNEDFIYKVKDSKHKMALCAALDKFECRSDDSSSPSLKISVFKFGSEEIISTRDWDCHSWRKDEVKMKGTYATGGYGIRVQLTGKWDESSKATVSILSYYQTMSKCPTHLPFDCDACKISSDSEGHHCVFKGHLSSSMCRGRETKPGVHGRSVKANSGGAKVPAAKGTESSTTDTSMLANCIVLIGLIIIKLIALGIIIVLPRLNLSNQVHPAPAAAAA